MSSDAAVISASQGAAAGESVAVNVVTETVGAAEASRPDHVESGAGDDAGIAVEDLYRQAMKFYKENEGKSVVLDYDVKLRMIAFSQQAVHGPMQAANLPPLGALDMIGRDRRNAWAKLGSDMSKQEAMQNFVQMVTDKIPKFKEHLQQVKMEEIRRKEKEKEAQMKAEEKERLRVIAEEQERNSELERQRQEEQRRQIQDALNKQTFHQFKAYADQQYPSDPDRQAVLIRQLQEQHYRQYMQQVYQQQMESQASHTIANANADVTSSYGNPDDVTSSYGNPDDFTSSTNQAVDRVTDQLQSVSVGSDVTGTNQELKSDDVTGSVVQQSDDVIGTPQQHHDDLDPEEHDECSEDWEEDDVAPASMWTKKEIQDFKTSIRSEGGDSVISIGHGETVTVRVPTHADGSALFWEFATDGYDVAFGLFFEWVDHDDENEISVHISDSEDDDLEDDYNDGGSEAGDPEAGGGGGGANPCSTTNAALLAAAEKGPPTSVVVPIYRRDCHQEVYAGTHPYPGKGIYLLKFDNSYSLWRSKTLYYRVYYTK